MLSLHSKSASRPNAHVSASNLSSKELVTLSDAKQGKPADAKQGKPAGAKPQILVKRHLLSSELLRPERPD